MTVYFRFCANGGMAIRDTYENVGINEDDESTLSEILDRYAEFSTRELIDYTRRKGMAWDKVFKHGDGNHQIIPFKLIEKNDCRTPFICYTTNSKK